MRSVKRTKIGYNSKGNISKVSTTRVDTFNDKTEEKYEIVTKRQNKGDIVRYTSYFDDSKVNVDYKVNDDGFILDETRYMISDASATAEDIEYSCKAKMIGDNCFIERSFVRSPHYIIEKSYHRSLLDGRLLSSYEIRYTDNDDNKEIVYENCKTNTYSNIKINKEETHVLLNTSIATDYNIKLNPLYDHPHVCDVIRYEYDNNGNITHFYTKRNTTEVDVFCEYNKKNRMIRKESIIRFYNNYGMELKTHHIEYHIKYNKLGHVSMVIGKDYMIDNNTINRLDYTTNTITKVSYVKDPNHTDSILENIDTTITNKTNTTQNVREKKTQSSRFRKDFWSTNQKRFNARFVNNATSSSIYLDDSFDNYILHRKIVETNSDPAQYDRCIIREGKTDAYSRIVELCETSISTNKDNQIIYKAIEKCNCKYNDYPYITDPEYCDHINEIIKFDENDPDKIVHTEFNKRTIKKRHNYLGRVTSIVEINESSSDEEEYDGLYYEHMDLIEEYENFKRPLD